MIVNITCEQCGKQFESDGFSETEICPHCGNENHVVKKRATTQVIGDAPVIPHSENEQVFFKGAEILVTNARFIVKSKTFAMNGVTSVQGIKRSADYTVAFVLLIVGFVLIAVAVETSLWFLTVGIPILFLGMLACGLVKARYEIILATAGGEVMAYYSFDSNYISKIVVALNEAIISNSKP